MNGLASWLGSPEGWGQAWLVAAGAYALGCLAGGYYLVRWTTGQDMRRVGSGSVGARNVSTVLGPKGFVATLIWDVLKGVLAVWGARACTGDPRLEGLALLAVLAGHLWPLQLGFRGGKGVATSLGGLLVYDPELLGALALLFLPPWALLRRTILPGMIAYALLPVAAWFLDKEPYHLSVLTIASALVLYAHRRNLVEEWHALGWGSRPAVNSDKS